jgi:hypothetical protein
LAFLRSVLQLLVTANVVLRILLLSTLMMETILFSEASVLTKTTRSHIPEGDTLYSHRQELLKSYKMNTC